MTRVRGAAAASMPHMMQSLVSYIKLNGGNMQMVKERFDWLLPDLLKATVQEPDIDLIYVMVVAVHEVRRACHVPCNGHNVSNSCRSFLSRARASCPQIS